MIYLVTNSDLQYDYLDNGIHPITVEESLVLLNSKSILGVDTETEGFYPQKHDLLLLQMGDKHHQVVVDCKTIDISVYKDILTSTPIIFHNAKFDLRFLYLRNIYPFGNVRCTFLQEKILYNGYFKRRYSYADVAYNYCGIHVSKERRGMIHRLGALHPAIIDYSATDVVHLIDVDEKQRIEARGDKNLINKFHLENEFVSVLAYIENCGMEMDIPKMEEKIKHDLSSLEKCRQELDQFYFKSEKIQIPTQLTMFGVSPVDWNSPDKVLKVMKSLDIDLTVTDKKTGKIKESVEKKILKKYIDVDPIIPKYIEYKEWSKIISTYGQSLLDYVKQFDDNRLRTNYTQLKSTGRLSSGSDKDSDENENVANVNMQNIPGSPSKESDRTRPIYEREVFKPGEGNVFVVADYSQQEQVILANISEDEKLLEFFKSGESDMHSYVGKLIYKKTLGDISLKEFKEKHPDKRKEAKNVGFAINYNGNEFTIANNLGYTIERSKGLYDSYFEAFPGLADYFKKQKAFLNKYGYILISPITGSKYFTINYFQNKNIARGADYSRMETDEEYKKKIIKARKIVKAIENKAINFPVQGTAADMIKIALIRFFKWILDNNYHLNYDVMIDCPVHDEIVAECKKHLAEETEKKMKSCMEDASKIFCKHVYVKVDIVTSQYWQH